MPGSGIVRAAGKNVQSVAEGDSVLLSFFSCSSCAQCQSSHPAYCENFPAGNYVGRKGTVSLKESGEEISSRFFGQSSFSQYSVVAESSIVNVSKLLHSKEELKLFAPLGCGFQTGMGAVKNIAAAGKEDAVMVLGLGAVGMGALMVSKVFLLIC